MRIINSENHEIIITGTRGIVGRRSENGASRFYTRHEGCEFQAVVASIEKNRRIKV